MICSLTSEDLSCIREMKLRNVQKVEEKISIFILLRYKYINFCIKIYFYPQFSQIIGFLANTTFPINFSVNNS